MSEATVTKRYLSAQDVADEVGLSVQTIRNWFGLGQVPGAFRVGKRCWRISLAHWEAYKASGGGARVEAKAGP